MNGNGNPGTITSYSGNSNSINNRLTPNPNIEPGVFLSSSPEGTVVTTTTVSGSTTQKSTTVTVNGSTTTSAEAAPKPIAEVNVSTASTPTPNPPIATNSSAPPTPPIAKPSGTTVTDTRTTAATSASTKASGNKSSKKAKSSPATVVVKEKELPAYSPLLSNYISQEVISKIKAKYGAAVYDMKTVRVVQTNKLGYLVRLSSNGKFSNEIYYDEP